MNSLNQTRAAPMDIINNKYLNLMNWYVTARNNGFTTDGTIEFYKTIRERDADITRHLYAWVLDASADPDVMEGSALYQWSDEDGWILIFAAGTSDGSPISMREILDSLHTHENMGILENFSEREDGVLLYGGEEITDSRVDPLMEDVSRIDAGLSEFQSAAVSRIGEMSEAVGDIASSMDNIVSTLHASVSRIDDLEANVSTISRSVSVVSESVIEVSSAAHAEILSISSALHAETTRVSSAFIQTINNATSALTTTIGAASAAAKTSVNAASSALHREISSVSAAAISAVSAATRAINVTINNASSSITTNITAVSSALNAKIVALGNGFDPTDLERRVSAVEVEVGLASATLSQLESLVIGDP